mgnify:CR=1 FL=1
MLFRVEHGKSPFELNPELRAIEKFHDLTERQMNYVILSSDFKTPYRKQAIEQLKYNAAVTAGYKLEKDGKRLDMTGRNVVAGKDGKVEAARKYYKEALDKDEDYSTLLSLSNLIGQIREFNNLPHKSPTDLKTAVDLNIGKLDKLMETKKKLEEILDQREDAPVAELIATTEDETVDEGALSILAKVNQGIL